MRGREGKGMDEVGLTVVKVQKHGNGLIRITIRGMGRERDGGWSAVP